MDLADVHQARLDEDATLEALMAAHAINPHWTTPLEKLSELYRLRDEVDKANNLIERAIARAPLKAENHVILARFFWNGGNRHEGFDRLRHAVVLDPGLDTAWDDLCNWAANLECYQAVVDLAREQAAKRPGEIRSWMRLAQALRAIPNKSLLDDEQRQAECLAALDRVLQLRPWLYEAHDLKAQVLVDAQRWVEAQEACQSPVWKGRPPSSARSTGLGRLSTRRPRKGGGTHGRGGPSGPRILLGLAPLDRLVRTVGRHGEISSLRKADRLSNLIIPPTSLSEPKPRGACLIDQAPWPITSVPWNSPPITCIPSSIV